MHISIHVPRAGYDRLRVDDVHIFMLFLSTYPVRGTTPQFLPSAQTRVISIHVPRAGYDQRPGAYVYIELHFYPRTPCGVRPVLPSQHHSPAEFLSTYPVRGTTWAGTASAQIEPVFLSTYPVRGTTRCNSPSSSSLSISIHVPRAGYDITVNLWYYTTSISIHVPRAGYDLNHGIHVRTERHFYPRTPCGVRQHHR